MRAAILAIGTATPETGLSQEAAGEIAAALTASDGRGARAVRELYRRAGVDRRGLVAADASGRSPMYQDSSDDGRLGPGTGARLSTYAAHAAPLALRACRESLDRAGVRADRVTHLVTASCTGFEAPGVDAALMRTLGLPSTVRRTNVGFMGCHAAINALRVADALVRGEPGALALVCCVELCSLHFQFGRGDGVAVANALFADGAAACLVGAGDGRAPEIRSTGSVLFDGSADEMGWRIGDHGFEMRLTTRVPGLLRDRVGAWVDAWLDGAGLVRAGVRSWAVHPGGPRVVDAVLEGLGVDAAGGEVSREVLRSHGNMSSATVLFIVRRMLERGRPLPLAALAFGPGLAGESLLLVAPGDTE